MRPNGVETQYFAPCVRLRIHTQDAKYCVSTKTGKLADVQPGALHYLPAVGLALELAGRCRRYQGNAAT
jgi:hypothetical protein